MKAECRELGHSSQGPLRVFLSEILQQVLKVERT
jgi:hypothetical protein